MARKKYPGGRHSKYEPEFAAQVNRVCILVATDEDMAKFFEADVSTINNWKKDYPKFFESISRGKYIAHHESGRESP